MNCMEKEYTEFYDVFANLFKLHLIQLGQIYNIGETINDSIDYSSYIKRGDSYYTFNEEYGEPCSLTNSILIGLIRKQFKKKMKENNYLIKRRYTLYREIDEVNHSFEDIFKLFNGFKYRILLVENEYFLTIDPACVVMTIASIENFAKKGINLQFLEGFSVKLDIEDHLISGYLLKTKKENNTISCEIRLYRKPKNLELNDIIILNANSVYPESRPELLESFLTQLGTRFSIVKLIRRLSFLDSSTSSRDRFVQTLKIIKNISTEIFPLRFGDFIISLKIEPLIVKM